MAARPTLNLSTITLAILAGGEGSRMGRPKAELQINGLPILEHLLDRFRWPGPTLLVTAPGRKAPPGAELFDREVVDPVAGQGPLRGVLTGLESAITELVLFATVDMPNVGRLQMEWLCDSILSPEILGVMPGRPTAGRAGIEPFPSVFRTLAAPMVAARLIGARHSVVGLADTTGFKVIQSPADWPAEVWTNLNTLADLDRFQAG